MLWILYVRNVRYVSLVDSDKIWSRERESFGRIASAVD